ncbi:MAG: HD domain-containing protein [Candidatus Omnitrophica bacterium]|nr:HD domain-containing protein [Candidatus Omnitrophota bacterium]
MAIDYKKELESAAKSMILVHEPDTLIKMIVRMLVQKVKTKHAAILLHQQDMNSYILTVSRGALGLKVPKGFARMDSDNALIRFFREHNDRKLFNNAPVVYQEAKKFLAKRRIEAKTKRLIKGLLYQMEIFDALICIPSYFRDDLLGILLLGRKNNGKKFGRDELDFFVALTSDVAMAIRNAQLFRELELELERNKRLFIHTTIALAAAIDAKDHYTHGHTARVTGLSLEIAHRLMQKKKDLVDDKKFLEYLHIAALLHDIGKIGIPEAILNKNSSLDEQELKRIREHPSIGVAILEPIKELEEAILGVKYHHEKYDGSGYPEGLKGKQIPLIAAIISVADTFDAMTTTRPYRQGLSKEKAIEEIKRTSGQQLDPEVVSAFVELYQEGKI